MERKFYLDFLKVIATFGVIFLHVSITEIYDTLGSYNWYVSVVGDGLVRWSVPIFVMISGVLFLDPFKELSITNILKKYVKRLLKAYVFWYIVYCIYRLVRLCYSRGSLVIDYQLLEPEYHLWFLPMLIGVYLLVPALRLVACDHKILIYSLSLWIFYLTISFILIRNIIQISNLFTMNIVVGYAGYFLLGYFLSLDLLSKHQRHVLYFLGVVGVIITILGSIEASLSNGVISFKYFFNVSPQVLVMAASLFVFVMRQSSIIESRLKGFIEFVRKDLFGIYLVHIIWLYIFNRGIFRDMCNHAISIVLISLLIFFFSLYTTKILRKIPYISQFVE